MSCPHSRAFTGAAGGVCDITVSHRSGLQPSLTPPVSDVWCVLAPGCLWVLTERRDGDRRCFTICRSRTSFVIYYADAEASRDADYHISVV